MKTDTISKYAELRAERIYLLRNHYPQEAIDRIDSKIAQLVKEP